MAVIEAKDNNHSISAGMQQAIATGELADLTLISIPPLAQQKCVIEKCDRLISLCDTLEAKLKQGRDSSEKLMEVAAKQILTT